MICKKISAIKIKTFSINVYELIIGASFPYIVDIFKDYSNDLPPDYFPIFICGILLVATFIFKKIFSRFNDYSIENSLHLAEIREMIDDINSSQEKINN